MASPGQLQFSEIIPSLQQIASNSPYSRYKSLIAIGDGSLDIAKEILEKIPKVKLVIYGRSFGTSKNMKDEFPLKWGNHGWIATAGKYGSTLGKLVLDINDSGIVDVTGQLVEINHLNGETCLTNYKIEFQFLCCRI